MCYKEIHFSIKTSVLQGFFYVKDPIMEVKLSMYSIFINISPRVSYPQGLTQLTILFRDLQMELLCACKSEVEVSG